MKVNKINRCARCMKELAVDGILCPDCGYDQKQGNSERALPVGTVLNGKYSIGAVLGEGGFGITYAAWDTLIETRIAIKEYFPSELVTRNTTLLEGKAACSLTLIQEKTGEGRYRAGLERFIKEAENIAKFQKQQGVVSVKDFFYENNTAYMVMEYIDGVTLGSYLERCNGKLGKDEAFQMMEPVIKTLEAIHKEGVIHRDISPDNIMVTADVQMKLIDFGAARFVGADDEKSLTVILKHGYAPEEQYRSNGEQGPWTDVYALSAVIYRMLTGKVPEETLKRMAEKQDSVRSELGKIPGLSAAERKGLEKGLAIKAEKRYRTIGDLYEGIYGGKKQSIWKWAVGVVLSASAVLCVFIIGLGGHKTDEIPSDAESAQEESVAEESLPVEDEAKDTVEEAVEDPEEVVEEAEEEPEEIISYSAEELKALVEEYSGKKLGEYWGKPDTSCYDDFDGDGRYELFACVLIQPESTPPLTYGDSIWFSDGEQTLWVTDLEGYRFPTSIGTLQFGKTKHFRVGCVDGGRDGDTVTTCALEENIPHSILDNEPHLVLDSEDGRTYCRVTQVNPYVGSNTVESVYYENYSIFYKDGEYWEYASKVISATELQQYTNGSDILNQIIEMGKSHIDTTVTDRGIDYSEYPYIEVESILRNSEYDQIFVNMRHWKSEEEAEYYKSLTEDALEDAFFPAPKNSIVGCLQSETRLSVKENMLQIDEMKLGKKEVSGTEFKPLYPD